MTFLYKCIPCSERNEKDFEFDFNHIPRNEPSICPKCGSKQVEKRFSPGSLGLVVNGANASNHYGLKPNKNKKY